MILCLDCNAQKKQKTNKSMVSMQKIAELPSPIWTEVNGPDIILVLKKYRENLVLLGKIASQVKLHMCIVEHTFDGVVNCRR